MSGARPPVLVADIGKTRTRIALVDIDGRSLWRAEGDGVPGLAASDASAAIFERIVELSSSLRPSEVGSVSAGVAGAMSAPAAADALAARLARTYHGEAVVASDIVTAHIGALAGAAGTVLVAGTGAVAMGISDDGEASVVDGNGPEVGDLGGGAWLGRAGITAALRSRNGVTGMTELAGALGELLGPDGDLHRWLSEDGNVGGRLGRFAPAVLDCAERGDPAARAIVADAVRMLTDSAAATGGRIACVLGGLVSHTWFAQQLGMSFAHTGIELRPPLGTALDGARLAAINHRLPHERYLHRA